MLSSDGEGIHIYRKQFVHITASKEGLAAYHILGLALAQTIISIARRFVTVGEIGVEQNSSTSSSQFSWS